MEIITESKCSVDNCEKQAGTKGLCPAHYQRQRKTGDVQSHIPVISRTRSTKERFVNSLTVIDPPIRLASVQPMPNNTDIGKHCGQLKLMPLMATHALFLTAKSPGDKKCYLSRRSLRWTCNPGKKRPNRT
jgi:hypothetical protein